MHMTGGEIFTRAQEVTECFVSVGNDDVSTVIDRYRSTFELGMPEVALQRKTIEKMASFSAF